MRIPNAGYGGACMTFEEIGRRLGITRGGAFMLYRSALKKMRRRKSELEKFRELIELRENSLPGNRLR